jgi:hypothetical protein
MEYYSAIKKNEIMSFAGEWMELEIIMLCEISKTEKDKCDFPYMWHLEKKRVKECKMGRPFGLGITGVVVKGDGELV